MTRRTALAGNIIQWLLVGLSIFWTVVLGPLTGVTTSTVLFVFAIPFFILHGLRRYGLRAILLFVVSTFIISNAFENFSILYGFPFGHYHYTGGMSWHTANVLLGLPDTRLDRWIDLVLLPVIAAAVMTMFDLTSDPGASTVARVWAWENGGGYFGVPATNFMGWWLITYVFFQIFALYLRRERRAKVFTHPREFLLQPTILYLNLGLITVVNGVTAVADQHPLTALNGVTWREADINEATMTVFLFTMCVVSLLADARLYAPAEVKIPH